MAEDDINNTTNIVPNGGRGGDGSGGCGIPVVVLIFFRQTNRTERNRVNYVPLIYGFVPVVLYRLDRLIVHSVWQ